MRLQRPVSVVLLTLYFLERVHAPSRLQSSPHLTISLLAAFLGAIVTSISAVVRLDFLSFLLFLYSKCGRVMTFPGGDQSFQHLDAAIDVIRAQLEPEH